MPGSRFQPRGVSCLTPRIDRGLLLTALKEVPYYRDHWRDVRGELLFFEQRGIDWERRTVTGLRLRKGVWRMGEYTLPRTVYNRCFPEPRALLAKLSEAIGPENVFNQRTQLDKWEVWEILSAAQLGACLPKTYLFEPQDLSQLLQEHKSLILKPRRGHGGAGVFKLTLLGPELVLITSHGLSFPVWGEALYLPILAASVPSGQYLVQQYIDSLERGGVKFDVRLVFQKNAEGKWEVTGELSRVTAAENLLTNGYHAVVPARDVVPPGTMDELHALGRQAAEALDGNMGGLGELGVDFLLDKEGKPWVLEVNGKPDKGLFWRLGDGDMLKRVYVTPLEYQYYLIQAKTSAPGSIS